MITYITGRAGSGKSEEVLRRIEAALEAGRTRLILLVPEQQAVVWERRAAKRLPPSASLSLEIVNFKRLCNLVRRTYGGMTRTAATAGTRAAVMWKVLSELRGQLSSVGGRPDRAVEPMLAAVAELKRSGISTEALSAVGERLRGESGVSGRAGTRAADLSRVAAAYDRILRERYEEDDEDLLRQLVATLDEHDFFRGADVFVDSFFSVTATEAEVLRRILRQADNVTVTFNFDDGGEPQFDTARDFLGTMIAAAPGTVKRDRLTENLRTQKLMLRHLEAHLWQPLPVPYEGPDDGSVALFTAADRYDEAECAACRVEALVQSGARYGEIALIARSADALSGILDAALRRHDIPFFLSERKDVSAHPAARLALSALAVVGAWRREDVIRCAKTGLCGLTDDECDALESYTATWHVVGRTAFEIEWTGKPEGYVAEPTRRPRVLTDANRARAKLCGPLGRLADVFRDGPPTVRDGACAVFALLDELGVENALRRSAAQYAAAGRADEAERERQIWQTLMNALDEPVDVMPDERADASALASLLRQTLAAADVGAIPSGVDEVVIGSANQVRLGEVAHVIVLGAIEGEFPATPRDDGYFTDAEKSTLEAALGRELGDRTVTLSAGTDARMSEEQLWFYRAVTLPHESLTVFIPQTNDGAAAAPSLGAERIAALFPALTAAPMPARDRLRTVAGARRSARLLTAGDRAVLRELGVTAAPETFFDLSAPREAALDPATAAVLYPNDLYLTQSRLNAFADCPFGYTAKYVLKLEEEKDAALTAVNVGTFLHSVFELFFRAVADGGRSYPLDGGTLRALGEKAVEDTVEIVCPDAGKRTEYLIGRLRRFVGPVLASLNEEFAQSDFRPMAMEEKIADPAAKSGEGRYLPAWRIPMADGRGMCLTGTIDRFDVYRAGGETYVRVVDYKTGSKDFREADLSIGVNTQLFLYLFTLLRCPPGEYREWLTGSPDGAVRPAGAVYLNVKPDEAKSADYLSARDPRTEEVTGELSRSAMHPRGIVLADGAIQSAMDRGAESGRPSYLPTQNGKINARTEEEFEVLEQTVADGVRKSGEGILAGLSGASPRPASNPCRTCRMKPLCRNAKG